jgi:hypothetical protein
VHEVLLNNYPIAQKKQEMLDKGKSQRAADEWEQLTQEITQVCVSKQLVPTVCLTQFNSNADETIKSTGPS